ncbi:trace amine-associated receptor 7e-like [Oculina patagonica]
MLGCTRDIVFDSSGRQAADQFTMNKTHLTCSFLDINLDQTGATQTANVVTCVVNSIFSIVTCMGNFLILHVIQKTRELHSPAFILLFCLAASDLLVGLICQPFFVAYKIAELGNDFSVYCALRMIQTISGWITSGVSMLTLSVVFIDRLLALTLHLRYTTIVTVPRVFQITVCLWIFAITAVMLRFCLRNWIIIPVVILLLTFLITALSNLKIFQIVRRHRRQISQQQQSVQINTVNVLKCRKSAVTVLYVFGLFLIFYLPFCVTMLVNSFIGYTLEVKIAYDYVGTVAFINSFLNPLVYCWRIGEIRRAVKNTLRLT